MSGLEADADTDADGEGGHKPRADPWMTTVTNVSAFLAPKHDGGAQQGLRMAAAYVAFGAAGAEVFLAFRTVKRVRLWNNRWKLRWLLRGRHSWQAGTQNDERCWCFGVGGARRLVITPKWDGFLMSRGDKDKSWIIPRIKSVRAWLDEHKQECARLTSGADGVPGGS